MMAKTHGKTPVPMEATTRPPTATTNTPAIAAYAAFAPPPPPPYHTTEDVAGRRRWTSAVEAANGVANHNGGGAGVAGAVVQAVLPPQPYAAKPVVMPAVAANATASSPSLPKSNQPMSFFNGRFLLLDRLGSGGFGDVYRAEERDQPVPLAVKVEQMTESNSRPEQSFLFHEAKVLQEIHKSIQAHCQKLHKERQALQRASRSGSHAHEEDDEESTAEFNPDTVGITKLKYYGQDGLHRVLIMSLHGHSVENVHRRQGRLSLFATLTIADQVLSSLEHIHRAGYVHADLKPDNILFGRKDPEQLYLVDFGLSVRYRDREGRHRPLITNYNFVGTPRYASLRTHMGYTMSRRDDLEQLVYVMIYLYRGRLPWSGLRIDDPDAKERQIAHMKANLSLEVICAGCPEAFRDVLNYARCMEFEEDPQYEYLHLLLYSLREACTTAVTGDSAYIPAPPASHAQASSPLPQQHQQQQVPDAANDHSADKDEDKVNRRNKRDVGIPGNVVCLPKDLNILSRSANEDDVAAAQAAQNPMLSDQGMDAPAFFSDAIGQGILSGNATDTGPLSPRIDCLNGDGRSPPCLQLEAAAITSPPAASPISPLPPPQPLRALH